MDDIVVVDDHDEALEAIHQSIRSKKLSFDDILLVHFDAHPDLSVPRSLHADDVFKPQVLYSHLSNTDGGISEWIIPLVFAEHVSTVWWIRPNWTEQIPDGRHQIVVGSITPTIEELVEEDGIGAETPKTFKDNQKRLRFGE
jgi:hypothetical protein